MFTGLGIAGIWLATKSWFSSLSWTVVAMIIAALIVVAGGFVINNQMTKSRDLLIKTTRDEAIEETMNKVLQESQRVITEQLRVTREKMRDLEKSNLELDAEVTQQSDELDTAQDKENSNEDDYQADILELNRLNDNAYRVLRDRSR